MNSDVNEAIIHVVEEMRMQSTLDEKTIEDLYCSLEEAVAFYKSKDCISKELAYNLLVLHDNLEGALRHGLFENTKYMSSINAKVSAYIEELLLN